MRLNRVDPAVKNKFAQVAAQIAANHPNAIDAADLQKDEDEEAMAAQRAKESPKVGQKVVSTPLPKINATPPVGPPTSSKSSRQLGAKASLSDGSVIVPVRPAVVPR